MAYSEILNDEKAATCAAFFDRAVADFAAHGINHIDAVMTDNHWSYTHSNDLTAILDRLGAAHVLIRPHCPWQNGKVERFNRTLQTEWAYRRVFTTNDERSAALAPGSTTTTIAVATAPSEDPADQPPVTNLMAEYS